MATLWGVLSLVATILTIIAGIKTVSRSKPRQILYALALVGLTWLAAWEFSRNAELLRTRNEPPT